MPDGVRPYDGVGLGVAVSVGCCVEKEGGLGTLEVRRVEAGISDEDPSVPRHDIRGC